MKAKQHCFAVRGALDGHKILGGTMTADTMEEAARKVIATNGITYLREEQRNDAGLLLSIRHRHMRNNREVYVSITAHPEYLSHES